MSKRKRKYENIPEKLKDLMIALLEEHKEWVEDEDNDDEEKNEPLYSYKRGFYDCADVLIDFLRTAEEKIDEYVRELDVLKTLIDKRVDKLKDAYISLDDELETFEEHIFNGVKIVPLEKSTKERPNA